MTKTRFETESSIWIVDTDAQVVSRMPKSEDPSHDNVTYDEIGKPEPYKTFEVAEYFGADVIRISFDDGRVARSGEILSRQEW